MRENIGQISEVDMIRSKTRNDTRIRAGIVGAGLMGRWHAHAIHKVGGRLVGIADVNIFRSESLASKYPGADTYDDFERMIDELNLDVLHVCSPLASHAAIAEKAIDAGVHLLVEKPLAASAAETSKLYALAADHNILLCPVHQFVFQRGVEKARRLLPSIGRLTHLEANICSAGGIDLDVEQHDYVAETILPHPLSLMQIFLDGEISNVNWNILRPAHGELRIYGQQHKTSLSIFISMNTRPTVNTFRIAGVKGTIHLDLFHGFSFVEPGNTSKLRKVLHPFDLAARSFTAAGVNILRRTWHREPAYPGLQRLIKEFYRSIKLDLEPPIKAADALAIATVCDLLTNRDKTGTEPA